jgi:Flp pilus assembly pilin Flp
VLRAADAGVTDRCVTLRRAAARRPIRTAVGQSRATACGTGAARSGRLSETILICWESAMLKLISRCLRDENGTEVIEYALLLGLLVLGCLVIMGALGIKLIDKWNRIYELL